MEFLEVPLFDDDLFKLLVRFSINVVFLAIIVRFAVYPAQREREFSFTAVMMNVTVFFICFALKKLDLGLGMALGLFAIFGVLRYRTDAIRVKEMTYLFIVIGIAVINSLSNKNTSYAELFTVNLLIFFSAMLKERIVGRPEPPNRNPKPIPDKKVNRKANKRSRRECKHTVLYDKLELLGPAHHSELLADLRQRTNIDVVRTRLQSIDLSTSTATLIVWCVDRDITTDDDS